MGHPLAGPNNTGPAHCWDRGGVARGVGRWRRQSIRRWLVTRWAATVARAWRSGSRMIWGERGVGGGLTGDVRGGTCGWWGTGDGSWCRWSRGLMSGSGSGMGTRWRPWWRKDPSSWCFEEASSRYRRLKDVTATTQGWSPRGQRRWQRPERQLVAGVRHHGARMEWAEASEEQAKESFILMKPCHEGIRSTAHRTWAVWHMRGDTVQWWTTAAAVQVARSWKALAQSKTDPGSVTVALGQAQFGVQCFSQLFKNCSNFVIQNKDHPDAKNIQTWHHARANYSEQLLPLGRLPIRNIIQVIIFGTNSTLNLSFNF
jgi:hypothetical protein